MTWFEFAWACICSPRKLIPFESCSILKSYRRFWSRWWVRRSSWSQLCVVPHVNSSSPDYTICGLWCCTMVAKARPSFTILSICFLQIESFSIDRSVMVSVLIASTSLCPCRDINVAELMPGRSATTRQQIERCVMCRPSSEIRSVFPPRNGRSWPMSWPNGASKRCWVREPEVEMSSILQAGAWSVLVGPKTTSERRWSTWRSVFTEIHSFNWRLFRSSWNVPGEQCNPLLIEMRHVVLFDFEVKKVGTMSQLIWLVYVISLT